MRSIFVRILLWFVGSLIATLAAFVVTSFLFSVVPPGPLDFVGRTLALHAEESRLAYEEGGPDRLGAFLRRLDVHYLERHAFTDRAGRDLVDGTDRSALLRGEQRPPYRPRSIGGEFAVVHPTADGRYRFIVRIKPRFELWSFLPYYLWILLVIGVLCYLLAVHIAAPLRRLRHAVERFGEGDLSTRLRSTRTDEIGDLARSFDRMAGRIATLLEAERRLLQDVSHELRSPLTRLGFALELARGGPDRDAALARARREADRLATLVDELLRLTRSEGDPAARAHEEVALHDLLRDLVSDGALEAEPRGCTLDLRVAHPAFVSGDRELLGRAVENVLRNAVRHAPEGTAVELSLDHHAGVATVTVRDHGPGVPEGQVEAIFEPFYRVEDHRDRSSGGVGLGLAIARRAVALHHGRIEARNAGPGLAVTITLPESAGADHEATRQKEQPTRLPAC